jgi:UDP-N-acetylglucosamine 1-carboxyvinyltransferase
MSGWDEALTYIMAAGITGGELQVNDFSLQHIRHDAEMLRSMAIEVYESGSNVNVSAHDKRLRAFDLFTAPYPGINSDLQPLFATLASQCHGESTVTDQRFTDRFQYVTELQKLGVEISAYGNCAIIQGPSRLKGASVKALDLRCGAALILAALAAEGTTVINNSHQILRGYEQLVPRMRNLGVDIESIED